MAAHNAAEHIEESIRSVLRQTFQGFELIIVDDGSKDYTVDVAEKFNDTRIKVFSQDKKGQSAALNYGIKMSTGKYIKFLMTDLFIS